MYFLRFVGVAAVIVVVGVSVVIGNAVGASVNQSAALGLLIASATLLSVTRVLGNGADSPTGIVAIVLLVFAAITVVAGKEVRPQTNGFVLFAGTIAVGVAAYLLLSVALTAATKRVTRSRRARQRRKLAADRGWRFEPSDDNLPSQLGDTDHYVVNSLPEGVFAVGSREVPRQARAHAIVRGQVRGVEFTAFDFFVPSSTRPPVVTTAWLVRLPHALPLFTSAEMFRDAVEAQRNRLAELLGDAATQDDEQPVAATHPEYARAVMTDEVVALTRGRLPSWWVDGAVLASTAGPGPGASPDLLARRIDAITSLATVLSSPQVGRYALQGVGSDLPEPHAT